MEFIVFGFFLYIFIKIFYNRKKQKHNGSENIGFPHKSKGLDRIYDVDVVALNEMTATGGELTFTFVGKEKEQALHILDCINKTKKLTVNKENSDVFYRIMALVINDKKSPNNILSFFNEFKKYVIDKTGFVHKSIELYILDCHVLLGNYDKYIKIRKNYNELGTKTHTANNAINVHYQANRFPINTLDLIWLTGDRKSQFIKDNPEEFLLAAESVFSQYADENNGWFSVMERHGMLEKDKQVYGIYAFQGYASMSCFKYPFNTFCFYTNEKFNNICKKLQKEAESIARVKKGLKPVGQGWISETTLFFSNQKSVPIT